MDKKPYRATGYTLVSVVSKPMDEATKEKIKQIYYFRKEAAKVYKFDPRPAAKIKEFRKLLKLPSNLQYVIENKKYNFNLAYTSDNQDRKTVLIEYRNKIQSKRRELRNIDHDFTQTGYSRTSKVHIAPNGVAGWFYQKLLLLTKRPTTKAKHIGIEIEGGVPIGADYSVFKTLSTKVSIAGDGSIGGLPKGYKPQEFRLLTTWSEYEKDVTELCAMLKRLGMIVNETCGLHVHLDMRKETAETVTAQFTNLVRAQKYLQGIVQEKRRSLHYCKPTRACDPFRMHDRYHAINGAALRKFETIEVRLHHGTTDETEIINWIAILLNTISADPIKRTPTTLESWMKKLNLKDTLKTYVVTKTAANPPVQLLENGEFPEAIVGPPAVLRATSLVCGEDHEDEDCLDCGQSWDSCHSGHDCQDEDGNDTGERGRFPGCRIRQPIPSVVAILSDGTEVTNV